MSVDAQQVGLPQTQQVSRPRIPLNKTNAPNPGSMAMARIMGWGVPQFSWKIGNPLEIIKKTMVLGKVACPNGSYVP